LNKLESPGPRDAQILSDLVKQFLRRTFSKYFPTYYYVNVKAPGVGPYMTLGTSFEQS